MPSDTSRTSKDFLENLIENISDSAEQDPDSLKEALAEEGLNYSQLSKEGLQLAQSLEREQRLKIAREMREKLLGLIDAAKQDMFKGSREKLVTAFQEILTPGDEAVAAFFHKLETVDDEDLRKMLNKAELLDIIAKQLKEDKSK